jgi:hypothetical protein
MFSGHGRKSAKNTWRRLFPLEKTCRRRLQTIYQLRIGHYLLRKKK